MKMRHVDLLINCKHEKRLTRSYRHMLLAIHQKADRIGRDPPAGLKSPERFARIGVEREEIPFTAAAENQPPGGRKQPGHGVRMRSEFPPYFAGLRLQRFHRAVVFDPWQVAEAASFEQLPGPVFFFHLEVALRLLI